MKNIYKLPHVIALVMIYFFFGFSQLNAQSAPGFFTMSRLNEFPKTHRDAVKFMASVKTGYHFIIGKSTNLSQLAAGNYFVKLESALNANEEQFIKTNY